MAHTPTEETRYTVEVMTAVGVDHNMIARCLGVAKNTMYKHYRDELDLGKVRMITKVGESLMRKALAGDTAAAIFIMKCQAGWRERDQTVATIGGLEVVLKNVGSADAAV